MLQPVYYIVGICCSVFAILLQWSRYRRDKSTPQPDAQQDAHKLKNYVRKRTVDTLCEHMIPIRRLYIESVSDEERLRREVGIIFDKPGVQQTFSELYYQLFEYESYARRKQYSRYARTIAATISVLMSLPLVLLPLMELFQDSTLHYDPVDWIMLVILVEATITVILATAYMRRLDRKLADAVTQLGSEPET